MEVGLYKEKLFIIHFCSAEHELEARASGGDV